MSLKIKYLYINGKKRRGYSLLELLIALFILNVGLLGFAEAQLVALRSMQSAYSRTLTQLKLISLDEDKQISGQKS